MSLIEKFLSTRFWKAIASLSPRIYGKPKFNLENYFIIRQILRDEPDSIYCFVGSDDANLGTKLQRLFYNAYWSHSGFIKIGTDGEVYIDHVRWFGRKTWALLKYLREVDNFALIKIRLNSDETKLVKEKLEKIASGEVYYRLRDNIELEDQYKDPEYWQKSKEFVFYCSEYQYFVLQGLTNNPLLARGRSRYIPDDLYKSGLIVWQTY